MPHIRNIFSHLRALWLICLAAPVFAGEIAIEEVLWMGPFSLNAGEHADKAEAMKQGLVQTLTSDGLPVEGDEVRHFGDQFSWKKGKAGEVKDGVQVISFNMETSRYTTGTLKPGWDGEVMCFVNGEKQSGSAKDGFKLKLVNGSFRVLLLLSATDDSEGSASPVWESESEGVSFHIKPQQRLSAQQLYYVPSVNALNLSADGNWLILGTRSRHDVDSRWENRIMMRDMRSGKMLRRWLDGAPSSFVWSNKGARLAYRIKNDVWVEDIESGETQRVLTHVEGLGSFQWGADDRSIFFHWRKDGKKDTKGLKRYRALEDRWSYWRPREQIFQVDLDSGLMRQISDDEYSHRLLDVHPDGSRIIAVTNPVDYSQPPHSPSLLFEINIITGESKQLARLHSLSGAAYGDDRIWIVGGPAEFDHIGNSLGKDVLVNDYEGELYSLDASGKASAHSRDFDPAINQMFVLANGNLLLGTTDRDRSQVYLYNTRSQSYELQDFIAKSVRAITISNENKTRVVWSGDADDHPLKVWTAALGEKPQEILDPSAGMLRQSLVSEVRRFDVTNDENELIQGRFFLPPNFDPQKKYPVIVHYYGGTVPITEYFTGRYPMHLWTANGYIVYICQGSGAIGYGQAFSAEHVNAWGNETADDIIHAVKSFTDAHDFADGERVGCIGASYGGFMTMYLLTRTDIFSAGISHAGISSLTGYWGMGWWGYAYSGAASKNSFPWNNPDLYVKQSPVYAADKITTPLLLLHGDADTNVPPEQSHVMYTAMKMLGKDVEFITYEGEDHWILDHDKRFSWWDTILAYFDKNLKQQPEWWDALYPE